MKKSFSVILLGFLVLVSCNRSGQNLNDPENRPQPVAFGQVSVDPGSRLGKRALANFLRLERGRYVPDSIYLVPDPEYHQTGWPGDVPGRLVLGQTLLQEATGRKAKYLDEILREFPGHLNQKGYFGHDYGDMINEQQLSGHGWVLRGLCENYLATKDTFVLDMIKKMVDDLVLPTEGEHSDYPIDPSTREDAGGYMGTSQKSKGKWILSSDIGCDFIFMDGVIQAYDILRTPELKAVSEEMINRFLEVDLAGIRAQTHATLTGLRALVRYYAISGDTSLLNAAESRYRLYREEAMTENFENYNWFGRPRWTEPCAVIDSYILAVQLWQYTGKAEYLSDAQRIYYNGMGVEQRYNGGFGCNSCLGNHDQASGQKTDPFLTVSVTESHWCCTMRGGEGLARAIQYSYFTRANEIFIPDFQSSHVELDLPAGSLSMTQKSDYPYGSGVNFFIDSSALKKKAPINIFIPVWISDVDAGINGKSVPAEVHNGFLVLRKKWMTGDIINISFSLQDYRSSNRNINSIKGYRSFWHGPLMLGHTGTSEITVPAGAGIHPAGDNTFGVNGTGITLQPVNHLMDSSVTRENGYSVQVLFSDGKEAL